MKFSLILLTTLFQKFQTEETTKACGKFSAYLPDVQPGIRPILDQLDQQCPSNWFVDSASTLLAKVQKNEEEGAVKQLATAYMHLWYR